LFDAEGEAMLERWGVERDSIQALRGAGNGGNTSDSR
jgi:hypothetical protein